MGVRIYPDAPRIYLDMDGVLADFEARCAELDVHPQVGKLRHDVYDRLKPMPGAIDGVSRLFELGYELAVLTKIPSKNPHAASQKLNWLSERFPSRLSNVVIITPDKGCVGSSRDWLIDDHPEWANAHSFPGEILHFGVKFDWPGVVEYFTRIK